MAVTDSPPPADQGKKPLPPTSNVRTFAPEQWGQLDRFANLYGNTFEFSAHEKRAISGAASHFHKAIIFRSLAESLKPTLSVDEEELQTKGHTPARNSAQLSAVVEVVFTELYSSVDCTRKVIAAVYKKCRGLPTDSTRRMFERVRAGGLGADFPDALKTALANARWFDELRLLRDELTHSSVGQCRLNADTGSVFYMHSGIQRLGKPLIIDDVFKMIDELFEGVNGFLGKVFHHLNSLIKDDPILLMCGIFSNRVYMRRVIPSLVKDVHSGNCDSHRWFDLPGNPRCPLADICGAYPSGKRTHQSIP